MLTKLLSKLSVNNWILAYFLFFCGASYVFYVGIMAVVWSVSFGLSIFGVLHNIGTTALFLYAIAGYLGFRHVRKWAELNHAKYSLLAYLKAGAHRWPILCLYVVLVIITVITGLSTYNVLFPFFFTPLLAVIITMAGLHIYLEKMDAKESGNVEKKNYKTTYNTGDGLDDIPFVPETVIPTGDDEPIVKDTSHGKAAWITDKVKNTLTSHKDGKPAFEGLWIGGGFFNHREGNLISVAPPGTGKGAALIIPNLLWKRDYKHSLVVFDPKGTNSCITARYQKEVGQRVIIIDPTGLQQMNNARHGIPASCFNPLDHITHDLFNGTAQIANLLLPDDPHGEKFWNQDARNLIQSILLHIMTAAEYEGERTLITLHKIIIAGNFAKIFEGMISNKEPVNGIIRDAAMGFSNMMLTSEKTFSSVRSVASASIKWLSNPSLQDVLKKSDFSPDELENGGITLYLCQPIQNKEGFATFSRLIIGSCLRANSKPAAKPKAWVYYLLDEFPTMGVFPEVVEALAYSREYRMRLWIFAQSLSQLDMIYNQAGRHQILGNARIFQAFGVTDHITQEYVSKRIGNQTIQTYSESFTTGFNTGQTYNPGGAGSSSGDSRGHSQNVNYAGAPLITSDQVEYDPNIITMSEWGPMRLFRWQYWQNISVPVAHNYYATFNDGRADPNPNFV